MSTVKKEYSATDAQPVVLYVKTDADSLLAYPLTADVFGTNNLAVQIDDVSTASVTYIGYAPIGSLASDAVWKVKKINEGGTPITTVITWANAGVANQVFTNRTSLTYT